MNAKGMLEQSYNARNKQGAACRQFITLFKKADVCSYDVIEAGGFGACARSNMPER